MKIKGQTNYNNQFYIVNDSNSNTVITPTEREISEWCENNCKSKWIISNTTGFYSFVPINDINPINGEKYKPVKQHESNIILLMFEDVDEAAAFKMTFLG